MSVGIDYLASIQFQLAHLWDFYIIDSPIDIFSSLTNITQALSSASMIFRVTSVNLPQSSLNTETNRIGNKYYTGPNFPENIKVSILEDELFSAYNYFTTWKNQVYNPFTGLWNNNPPSKIGILTFNSVTPYVPPATFIIEGMKIQGVDGFSLQRDTSGPLILNANMTCERVLPAGASSATSLISAIA
jgi:hypothetical protein